MQPIFLLNQQNTAHHPPLIPYLPLSTTTMATFRTTSITTGKRQSKQLSILSFASFAPSSLSSSPSDASPIRCTTTISTTSVTYPATVPPPFTTSRGSDERLPRPQRGRGAPPVSPAQTPEERRKERERGGGFVGSLRRTIGLKPFSTRLNPALCPEW
ncbi:hypothetical protein C8R46DRAFT_1241144 [Mycena filopes]|nr:hypothetical protein C8R46DRAFT_1241144 [Mycena filopes]